MAYYNGFVAAVPTANKKAYVDHVREAWPHFQKLGATRMVEAWGDNVPDGKKTDMKKAVQGKSDEAIVFSWIEWPDKATADKADETMRSDPAMAEMGKAMPFDGSRLIYGGFAPIYDSKM